MGMFIGTLSDLETIANLDAAFANDQLKLLNQHKEKKGKLFDSDHTLSRVAFRLSAHPSKARLKWFGLLDYIEQNYTVARDAIKNTLQDAIDKYPSVERVVFGVKHNPAGTGYSVDVDNGTPIYAITLVCSGDFAGSPKGADPLPDKDSQGNNVENPLFYSGPKKKGKGKTPKRKPSRRGATQKKVGKSRSKKRK